MHMSSIHSLPFIYVAFNWLKLTELYLNDLAKYLCPPPPTHSLPQKWNFPRKKDTGTQFCWGLISKKESLLYELQNHQNKLIIIKIYLY